MTYRLVNLVHREESSKYNLVAIHREDDNKIFAINYVDTEFTDEGGIVEPVFEFVIYILDEESGELVEEEKFELGIKDVLLITEILTAGLRRVFDRLVRIAEVIQDAAKGTSAVVRIEQNVEEDKTNNRFVR